MYIPDTLVVEIEVDEDAYHHPQFSCAPTSKIEYLCGALAMGLSKGKAILKCDIFRETDTGMDDTYRVALCLMEDTFKSERILNWALPEVEKLEGEYIDIGVTPPPRHHGAEFGTEIPVTRRLECITNMCSNLVPDFQQCSGACLDCRRRVADASGSWLRLGSDIPMPKL